MDAVELARIDHPEGICPMDTRPKGLPLWSRGFLLMENAMWMTRSCLSQEWTRRIMMNDDWEAD
jgi:hypothetical protein